MYRKSVSFSKILFSIRNFKEKKRRSKAHSIQVEFCHKVLMQQLADVTALSVQARTVFSTGSL